MSDALFETLRRAQKFIDIGNLNKAWALCNKALKHTPQHPDLLHLSGFIAIRQENYDHAIKLYNRALEGRPDQAIYYYNLGLALLKSGRHAEAVPQLQKAVKLNPELANAYSDLCLALFNSGQMEAAVGAGREAVTRMPESPAAHYNLALALDDWGDYEASFSHYSRAAKLQPEHPRILQHLGNAHVGRGELDAARQCFHKAIEANPGQVESYASLVHIARYSAPEHEDTALLKSLLGREQLHDDGRTALLFALGKIYQDCGRYDEAFAYYEQGNRLQDKKHHFELDELSQYVDSAVGVFSRELIESRRLLGHVSERPVFIVGTPRSGTTLVEQILSSHPAVFGAGELSWVGRATAALAGYLNTKTPYPACVAELGKQQANDLAAKYLRYISSLASVEKRVTDKMPGNFAHLGFMHILFPNARIIHCRREPRDACVSIYCHYFPDGHPYSYDLFKLGAFYALYQHLMAHWRTVLPAGVMLEVDYEALVENQEEETRRLVDHIGLEWDGACLEFYKKKRRVKTASNLQVTRPIYKSSVERWKRYKKHLGPLEEGLKYRSEAD